MERLQVIDVLVTHKDTIQQIWFFGVSKVEIIDGKYKLWKGPILEERCFREISTEDFSMTVVNIWGGRKIC